MINIHKKDIFKSVYIAFFIFLLCSSSGYMVKAATPIRNVSMSSHSLRLIAGGPTATLHALVLPANATNKSVTWRSSNEAAATVNSSGVVTPISEGVAVIIVKTVDGGYTDACIVNVITQPVTGISLDKNQATIKIGITLTLKPTIMPGNASNKKIIWTSGDSSVARVSNDGIVTPVSPGATAIFARTEDGDYRAFCIVSVVQEVDSVVLNRSSVNLNLGDSISMQATVKPDNIPNKDIIWTSSNPVVAYVNYEGKLVSVSKGTTVITAASVQDPTKKATCSVRVNAVTHVQKVTLNLHQTSMLAGSTLTLNKTVLPNDADDKTVTWSSTDESVAAVSPDGVVTAKSSGAVFIIVKSNDTGSADICLITVTSQPVAGISLDKNQATIKMGTTLTLKPTIMPGNASNKKIIWTSGDSSVARVSNDGIVTPVSPGATAIFARTEDGDYRAFCIVSVEQRIDSVALNFNSLNMKVGDSGVTLKAIVKPDNAANKNITWKSSNPNVVLVGSDGKVIPLSPGRATITATSVQDVTKRASCAVTVAAVNTAVSSVDLNINSANLLVGDTITLNVVITPGNAANKKVNWTSTDKNIAAVDSNGKVTAISPGNAIVVARANDGGAADVCIVNVSKETVTGISLSSHQETLKMGSTLTLKAVISPVKATNKTIEWSSGSPSIAKVDSKGIITPAAPGATVIMAKTEDGSYIDYCVVYVIQGVDNVTLDKNNVTLSLNSAGIKLNASVNPYNASNKDVVWKSSNPNVVLVDSNGYIFPVSGGTAVITVTSMQDKTKSASCTITITVPVTGVEIY